MQKPFTMSDEMLKELENEVKEGVQASNDTVGTGPGPAGLRRRPVNLQDRGSAASGSQDDKPFGKETIDQILAQRSTTHGDFTDHARITQALKELCRMQSGWGRLNDVQKEALDMNCHKIGRILAGNPNFNDHWDDIAGYAKLVSERIV